MDLPTGMLMPGQLRTANGTGQIRHKQKGHLAVAFCCERD